MATHLELQIYFMVERIVPTRPPTSRGAPTIFFFKKKLATHFELQIYFTVERIAPTRRETTS